MRRIATRVALILSAAVMAVYPADLIAVCNTTSSLEGLDPSKYKTDYAKCASLAGERYTTLWTGNYDPPPPKKCKLAECPSECPACELHCEGSGTHAGVDIARNAGTPVYASAGGYIHKKHVESRRCPLEKINGKSTCRCGKIDPFGTHVVVRHGSPPVEFFSIYAHLAEVAPGLEEGRDVYCGDLIGKVGNTGCSEGPHLHFQVDNARGDGWSAAVGLQDADGGPITTGGLVIASSGTRVRRTTGLSGKIDGVRADGDRGRVLEGPEVADGYTWWFIDYEAELRHPFRAGDCDGTSFESSRDDCLQEYTKSPIVEFTRLGSRCGDGVIDGPETCDDGNTKNGDGCSVSCDTEGVMAGPITNPVNGCTYYLLHPNRWEKCEAMAKDLGGHLVTINDAVENGWVFDNVLALAPSPGNSWIGLTDLDAPDPKTAASFYWASGDPGTYRNWRAQDPNFFDTEFCVHMVGPGGDFGQGQWVNQNCALVLPGIVEVP